MTDVQNEIANLASRLVALEKSNRIWKLFGLALVLVLFAVVLAGPKTYAVIGDAMAHPTTVTANQFILKDSNGQVRGRMMVDKGTPRIEFFDQSGRVLWSAPAGFGMQPVEK